MVDNGNQRVIRHLQADIESELNRVGLLFRVFSRAKDGQSLSNKIELSPGKYSPGGKLIQDLFGIRIALYFTDDLDIAQKALKNIFTYDEVSSTIDLPSDDTFSATRCNLIFRLPEELASDSETLSDSLLIDSTFEVQFRTVLSEGWHEVEHDLRYKCQSDWTGHNDLNRNLNGIYATLETSDWGMLKLFEEICHRHYKSREWSAMVRSKFRLRAGQELSSKIKNVFDNDPSIAKGFFRISRRDYLSWLLSVNLNVPVCLDNTIYVSNYKFIKCKNIDKITPAPILRKLQELC